MSTAPAEPAQTADGPAGAAMALEVCPDAAAFFFSLVSRDFARAHLIAPLREEPDAFVLAASEQTDPIAVHNTRVRLGRPVRTTTADGAWIAAEIDRAASDRQAGEGAFAPDAAAATDPGDAEDLERLLAEAERDLLSTSGKAPVVRLVDRLLFESLRRGASDLHVQPLADRALVRYRVDGVLLTSAELRPSLASAVVSRIKVMGRMDIAEKRIPQDGRSAVTVGDRSIDLRISTLPTSYGERAVIRLLDNEGGKALTTFEAIGMPDGIRSRYLERAARSSGIVLVTGPTGSGKTTTLYTTLRWIASRGGSGAASGGVNVMTIEDPIEYELSTAGVAISQAQVNTRKGVTFAGGLRHILRQDPDVIMVGEIRDAETARIAIQASLTGHLVFSTLHTNDAASAVTRLVDLGVEPYLVSASLSAVLAQRLVRRRHDACEGEGCGTCLESGFLGRIGVFELLPIDEPIRSLITTGADAARIRSCAIERGMRPLRDEGDRLAREGLTTPAEVARVTLGALDEEHASPDAGGPA